MKVIHRISEGLAVSKPSQKFDGFCLGDRDGGYLWLDDKPTSRYQGWFTNIGENLVKTLENVEVADAPDVSAIINNFWNVKRVRGLVTEEFFVPEHRPAMAYSVNLASKISLTFDIKCSFENAEFGRHYAVERAGSCILISFHNDNREGETFLALIGDSSNPNILQKWILRDYSYDRGRESKPYLRWVFKAIEFEGATRIVMAAGNDRNEVISQAAYVFKNFAALRAKRRRGFAQTAALFKSNFGIDHKSGLHANSELAASGICAINSLESLLTGPEDNRGLFAGFPWFFQFWQRDEALSLAGLSQADAALAFPVFLNLIEGLEDCLDGMPPDGIGWIFFAAADYISKHLLNRKEEQQISMILEKTISYWIKNQTAGGFAVNEPGLTWMDSLDRSGACIELQALRLAAYRLAARISASSSKRQFYHGLEIDLLLKTKKNFCGGSVMPDGYDPLSRNIDATVRPNIFLAAYAYPQLLDNLAWQRFFDAALPKLWLDWGGLSSIDIGDKRFLEKHSGENPASYHNGDSWFYVNNIAALVLHRTNQVKYHNQVKKIFAAGIQNVLWGQVPGYPSELSSSKEFDPAGCFNQAWSAATFLELFQAIGIGQGNGNGCGP